MVQVLELREEVLKILAICNASDKVAACVRLSGSIEAARAESDSNSNTNPNPAPAITVAPNTVFASIAIGRPDKPELINALKLPKRKASTEQGRLSMVHALAHIEFNAINLALDVIVRFNDLPDEFYWDWWGVAREEAYHFSMLQAHLQKHGSDYGAFDAHNGLWDMAERTQHKLTDRMAMVPRTLEARGLDACPLMRDKLAAAGEVDAAKIIDIILNDEIRHVALGNQWFIYACERDNVNPVLNYKRLKELHGAPQLRPPFNIEARRAAGFFEEELRELQP